MGQQPNVPLEIEDLPRRTPKPAAPRRWSPNRPGDLTDPAQVPWGGRFGTPGPDTGYALRLMRDRDQPTLDGESHHDLETALLALVAARASRFGRAPVLEDVLVAEVLLDVGRDDAEWRLPLTAGLGHKPWRATTLVNALAADVLESKPDDLRTRCESGPLIDGSRG